MTEHDTILIIDDEIQIRRLLEITLTAHNFNTCFAANGKEGLISAATHNPSLILLDLGLPDIDGLTEGKVTRPLIHPYSVTGGSGPHGDETHQGQGGEGAQEARQGAFAVPPLSRRSVQYSQGHGY